MICSDCLINEGLRIEAEKLGVHNDSVCPNCNSSKGRKLEKDEIQNLIDRFFRQGSIENNYHLPIYVLSSLSSEKLIPFREDIKEDLKLLKNESGLNVAYHGPPMVDLGYTDISADIEIIEQESKEKINGLIDNLFEKFIEKEFKVGTKFYRLRKNPKYPRIDAEYDSPPQDYITEGRLNSKETPIFYCSEDFYTCVHEVKSTVYDILYLAAFETTKTLKILSLLDYRNNLNFKDMNNYIAYVSFLFRTDMNYDMCQRIALRAKELGYDGIEYYSFFSKVIGARKSNIALFGYPLKDKILSLKSVNRLRIEKIKYDLNFGPVE